MATTNSNTVSAVQARKQLGELLDKAYYRNESFVVERAGEAKAAIVPIREYKQMQRRKAKAKKRFFAMTDAIRKQTSKHSPEVMQAAIDEAIRATRTEKKPA